jgi:hypothetical protein
MSSKGSADARTCPTSQPLPRERRARERERERKRTREREREKSERERERERELFKEFKDFSICVVINHFANFNIFYFLLHERAVSLTPPLNALNFILRKIGDFPPNSPKKNL